MINFSANHITCLMPIKQQCKTQQSMMKIAHSGRHHQERFTAGDPCPKHPLHAAMHFPGLNLVNFHNNGGKNFTKE